MIILRRPLETTLLGGYRGRLEGPDLDFTWIPVNDFESLPQKSGKPLKAFRGLTSRCRPCASGPPCCGGEAKGATWRFSATMTAETKATKYHSCKRTLRAQHVQYIIFYHIAIYCIILYYIILYSILFYSILFYSILLYYIILYHIIFYSILFYSILFYSIILYYIILYYIILYYIILYYIILYYIILYYIILYYIISFLLYKSPPYL